MNEKQRFDNLYVYMEAAEVRCTVDVYISGVVVERFVGARWVRYDAKFG
jgi:hypothetical protein